MGGAGEGESERPKQHLGRNDKGHVNLHYSIME